MLHDDGGAQLQGRHTSVTPRYDRQAGRPEQTAIREQLHQYAVPDTRHAGTLPSNLQVLPLRQGCQTHFHHK